MNKRNILIIAGVVIALVLAVVAFLVYQSMNTPRTDLIQVSDFSEVVTCALDTKICPDGNIVIRDTTNGCDFYECPVDTTNTSASESTVCTQEVKACADGTEVGRESSRNCQFKLCPDGTQLD